VASGDAIVAGVDWGARTAAQLPATSTLSVGEQAGRSRSDAVRWPLVSASLGIVVILLKLILH
jgi:hypothetical protein